MKTTTYHIESNLGFIGFVLITDNSKFLHGYLTLFETVHFVRDVQLIQTVSKQDSYNLVMPEMDIIRELMLKAIPSLRTNGLVYTAINSIGITTTI